MKINFQPTSSHELEEVNSLIISSRKIWNYDEEYFQKSLPLINVTEEFLLKNDCYSIFGNDEKIVGFIGIEKDENGDFWIEHLWVSPSCLKTGIGKKAIHFILKKYHDLKVEKLFIFPDPPAEGFYEKCGARFTGEKFPSRVKNGPEFFKMVLSTSCSNL